MKKILVLFDFPGVQGKQYDATWVDLRAMGHDTPKGLLHHTGAENGTHFMVVDVWESEEAFRKFGEALGPVMAKNNIPNVQPKILPVRYDLVIDRDKVPFP